MKQLVLHHRYRMGMAWDLSGLDNHGDTKLVTPGTADHSGSLQFTQPGSRVDVAPNPSLNPTGAFRCSILFELAGPPTRRYNLVESQASFAFFVDVGFRLRATILDANGTWNGVVTPMQIDPFYGGGPSGWYRVDCGHDGISTIWIAVEGRVVAVKEGVPGPVRPVGPRGLSIGHWPEPANQYTFQGHIAETWLWMNRPDPPADGCCQDREALARADEILHEKGWDLARARATLDKLAQAGGEVRAELTPAARPDFDRTAAQLRSALYGQDWEQVGRLSAHARAMTEAAVSQADRERLAGDVVDAMGDLLGDRALLEAAAQGLLCDKTPGTQPPERCDKERDWTHWGPERDPADDEDPGRGPDAVPPDVGYDPGRKPRRRRRPDKGQDDRTHRDHPTAD